MKFITFSLIVLEIFAINLYHSEAKSSSSSKNQKSLNFLGNYDSLDFRESCVICKFVLQKVDKEMDSTRECAEIAESEYIKEKQREWLPDQNFLSKWKMLYDIQKKQMNEKGKPFKHDDDHYYYIIHPDHIKNYIVIRNDTDNSTSNNCNGSNSSNSNSNTKIFTFNITEEHNETIVFPGPGCKHCKNHTNNTSNNSHNSDNNNNIHDNGDVIERKSITFQDIDNTDQFPNEFMVSNEFQTVSNSSKNNVNLLKNSKSSKKDLSNSNGFFDINNLNDVNGQILNKFFNPNVRFKTVDSSKDNIVNKTCNMTKTHNEVNIHTENKYVLPYENYPNYNNPQQSYGGSNVFRSQRKQTTYKEGPYQVDEEKLDKVFKRRGKEDFRYNANPSISNTITPNPLDYYLPGNFIIDKNINKGNFAPTNFLIPEIDYNYIDKRKIRNNNNNYQQFLQNNGIRDFQNNLPRFSQQNENPQFSQNNKFNVQNQDLSRKIGNSDNPKNIKEITSKEQDFNDFNEMDYERLKETKTVLPGDDRYEILKGGQYTGYGKALLPPHPEDLYPETDCCYSFPCVSKPPCKNLLFDQNQRSKATNQQYNNYKFLEKQPEQENLKNDDIDDSGQNFLFLEPSQIYSNNFFSENDQNIGFLQIDQSNSTVKKRHCKHNLPSKKNTSSQLTEVEKMRVSAFTFDSETHRRARRKGDLPDPEWDCLEKNIKDLIHFICEQEVSLGYMKYCKPLIDQMNQIIEGFLYHDTTYETCQNIHMCSFK